MNRKNALYGTLVTLAGAALWGLNAVVSKYLMGRGIDTMWMVNFRMITAGAVLLLFAFIKNRRGLFDIWKDRASIIRLLVIAVFAFALFLYGTSIVGPVRGGIYNLFEPVVALAASALWLGQGYHAAELFGTAAILAGIAIMTAGKENETEGSEDL